MAVFGKRKVEDVVDEDAVDKMQKAIDRELEKDVVDDLQIDDETDRIKRPKKGGTSPVVYTGEAVSEGDKIGYH